ncbi:hypothetical protein GQ43DRAFT_111462 [Delitschia confertaspora ATCC 74209]|uniref:BHLH domain-containing protein n=1 Tax=Delitschia confertaspora ATCC 74209 TaxID=1513339 RepID=A0A9P4JJV0_9PLEO|nr:hypothetical protein GQ43DRAFT_111462 [Delitschia confertaspora ATCC 74209]
MPFAGRADPLAKDPGLTVDDQFTMNPHGPRPFGYDFPYLGDHTGSLNDGGHSLLSGNESASLEQFFNDIDPFTSHTNAFSSSLGTKDDLDNTFWTLPPPPTIHGMSTTIPDQSHLQHGYQGDQIFASDSLSSVHPANTHDDLQAASTLYNNAHVPHTNMRSYSVPSLHTSATARQDSNTTPFRHPPTVATSQGLIPEQLAALLPHHSQNGSIDASIAAEFSGMTKDNLARLTQIQVQPPSLKRSYTYGTDDAFNPSGFVVRSPHETEGAVVRRLMRDLRTAEPVTKDIATSAESTKPSSPVDSKFPIGLLHMEDGEDDHSGQESSGEDTEGYGRPAKKMRKGKNASTGRGKNEKGVAASRKSVSGGRGGKVRKTSMDEDVSKKKRGSASGQKAQRENLTEEQKRNNHILSEQKRRNLIKRGFADLQDLVPELRTGSMSKSSVLMETATFLEKLMLDNRQYAELIRKAGG